jgi:hypothetical protein
LGDQKTIVTSDEEINGIVGFTNTKGELIESNISLVVHTMPGMDIIIGLPDINNNFLTILTEMLVPSSMPKIDFDTATISNYKTLKIPWIIYLRESIHLIQIPMNLFRNLMQIQCLMTLV